MKLFVVLLLTAAFNAQAFNAAKTWKTCTQCHSAGKGDVKGPDLGNLPKRVKDPKDLAWIVKFVNYPSGMIEGDEDEEGYEKPDLRARVLFDMYKTQMNDHELTADQIKKIAAYIENDMKNDPKGPRKTQGKILEYKKYETAFKKKNNIK